MAETRALMVCLDLADSFLGDVARLIGRVNFGFWETNGIAGGESSREYAGMAGGLSGMLRRVGLSS